MVSGLLFLELFGIPLPPGGGEILHAVAPLRIVNSYGLFAVMTTERPEIIVEGSNDGVAWSAYEFRVQARRRPPRAAGRRAAPAAPRLADVVRRARQLPVESLVRELHDPPVTGRADVSCGCCKYNPFPNAPPKYIRARVYLYHFTHWGSRDWWTREERGTYFPAVSLK